MHHLLETLPNKHSKKIKELIKLTELTFFSLMVNNRTAIVGTNKKLIICCKKFYFFYEIKWSEWNNIVSCAYDNSKGNIFTIVLKNDTWQIDVSSDKIYLLGDLEQKINKGILELV